MPVNVVLAVLMIIYPVFVRLKYKQEFLHTHKHTVPSYWKRNVLLKMFVLTAVVSVLRRALGSITNLYFRNSQRWVVDNNGPMILTKRLSVNR